MKLLIKNASQLVTCAGEYPKKGRAMADIGVIPDGAVLIQDGVIEAVGPTRELEGAATDAEVIDARGHAVLPGFVDSHTHFIFGGYRPEEFGWRLKGDTYLSIMERGGGINSTVAATRAASFEELEREGRKRLDSMLCFGVTTVEGKSGYGMDRDCEMRMLEVMKRLNDTHPVDIVATFLGPHSVMPEWKGKEGEFIDFLLKDVMPEVKARGLAEFADIFTERGAFDLETSERYLSGAKALGFKLKIHSDEITAMGGTELAVRLGARSCDHLLKVTDEGVRLLSQSPTIATLLPCTAFCLKEPYAPARRLIDSGAAVALASDCNPGSCFTNSIPLMIALGCIYMGMSVEEVITALTINAAAALDRADSVGSLERGKKADIVFLKYPSISFLPYNTAINAVERVIKNGETVFKA